MYMCKTVNLNYHSLIKPFCLSRFLTFTPYCKSGVENHAIWINTENIHPLPSSVCHLSTDTNTQWAWYQFPTNQVQAAWTRIDIWGSWPNLNLQCMYVDLLTCWLVCLGWVLDLSFQVLNFASTSREYSIVCTFVVPIPIQPLGHHYHSHHDIDKRTWFSFWVLMIFLGYVI